MAGLIRVRFGPSGVHEKRVVLAQARALRRTLEASGRYRVVVTRDRDIFVPLRERIAIARAAGADLFVSLHADSISDRDLRGGSIYTLSERASDKEAGALATKENKADLIAGIDLSVQSHDVVSILIDLAATRDHERVGGLRQIPGSGSLQKACDCCAGRTVSRVLRCLRPPDVPSVLVDWATYRTKSTRSCCAHAGTTPRSRLPWCVRSMSILHANRSLNGHKPVTFV